MKLYPATPEYVPTAVEYLRKGDLIISATDTLYGILGIPQVAVAEKIYEAKRRPKRKPLILFYDSVSRITQDFNLSSKTENLLQKYFPGAITFILPAPEKFNWISNTGAVGVRIPNFDFVRALIAELDQPLLSTSANLSGQENIMEPARFGEHFEGYVQAVFYSEKLSGTPSTVVDLSSDIPKILRQGGVRFG